MSIYNVDVFAEEFNQLRDKHAAERDRQILSTLNELVKRNLLVWQETQQTMFYDPVTCTLSLRSSGRLVLKDQEYVETLERENAELREEIAKLQGDPNTPVIRSSAV